MKNFMLTLLMLVGMTTFGQESEPKVLDWNTPIVNVNNTTYELVDVDEWGGVWFFGSDNYFIFSCLPN